MPYCSNCGIAISDELITQNQGLCVNCVSIANKSPIQAKSQVNAVVDELNDIRTELEWSFDVDGKAIKFDPTMVENLLSVDENFAKLAGYGNSLNKILSQATMAPETIDKLRRLFREAADLTDRMIPIFQCIEPLVKDMVRICNLMPKAMVTVSVVSGFRESPGFFSDSFEHISESDLVKNQFFYLDEGVFAEIIQIFTPYLVENSLIPGELANESDFQRSVKQLFEMFVLIGKYIHPNLLYGNKLKIMTSIEQKAQTLLTLMHPYEKFRSHKYLKPSIQNAMDKFELFVGPYELPAGKRIKLSGFFGTKDEIDVLLQCSKKLMELSLKKAQ